MSDTVIKKINNTIIFYERDNEKDIEQLFIDGFFDSDERENVKLINNEHWIKKHYFRKGLMKFLGDNYLFAKLQNTRSFQEYSILKYLVKKNFNTCKPIIGWVSSNMISYKANLVVEKIEETKTLSATLISIYRGERDSSTISSGYYLLGKEVAKMHHHGVFHGDLNANNILVTGSQKCVIICGGISAKLSEFFDDSLFFERLGNKGKYRNYVSDVPILLSFDNNNGLKGSAEAFYNPFFQMQKISN